MKSTETYVRSRSEINYSAPTSLPETRRKAGDSTGGERREERRLIHPLLRQLEERYEGSGEPAPLTRAAVEVHGEGGGRRLALRLRRHTQPL